MSAEARPQVALRLGAAPDGGTAILARHVEWPWSLPRGYRRAGASGPLTVLPQCAGAALLPGDHWRHRIVLEPGARADLVSAGAMLVHRGGLAQSDWSFDLGPGAALRHMPDPNVLMEGARMAQRIEIRLAAGATAVLFDGFCRRLPVAPEAGGVWRSDLVVTDGDGRAVLRDRQMVSESELIALGALPGGAAAFGSVMLLGRDDIPEGPCDLEGCYAAAGRLRGGAGMLIRIAAASGGALDRAFRALRARLA